MINIDTEEKQDSGESEYKFPIFFTVSGYMDSQLNPEIDDKYNSIIKPIDREIARRKMQNGMITRAVRNINISLTPYEDMGQSQKDLDTLIKLRDSLFLLILLILTNYYGIYFLKQEFTNLCQQLVLFGTKYILVY